MQIVIVEDNRADLALIKMAISARREHVDFKVFDKGHEAMAALTTGEVTPPDLILLDLKLPGVDGSQILARLRSIETFQGTPIIVLTSSADPLDCARAMELGATDFITKPKNLDGLLAIGARLVALSTK